MIVLMFKNFIVILACISLAFTGLLYYGDATWLPDEPLPNALNGKCVFEDKKIIENQQIFETSLVRAIVNFRPIAPGSILILPKRHVARMEDLTPDEWAQTQDMIKLFQLKFAKVYGKNDYVLIVQNGYYGGQTVPHAHFHMIPRGEESTLMKKIQLWNISLTETLGNRYTMSNQEMKDMIDRLK